MIFSDDSYINKKLFKKEIQVRREAYLTYANSNSYARNVCDIVLVHDMQFRSSFNSALTNFHQSPF